MPKYPEYKQLNLPNIAEEALLKWKSNNTFQKSIQNREGSPFFTFFEGPPSANGMPGIHHVMARAIKDIFCRYKTLQGFQVKRKAGWDTHGLPIELSVEKSLGITKEDIGKKITVEEYNAACRKEVMKYKDRWDELTEKMGYWVDLDEPYVTFDNKYIESVWYLLAQMYEKGLLYKGYTIQPYSWAAGTGLSSHELNQPGCYKNIKDTTVVAQFKVQAESKAKVETMSSVSISTDLFFLAWTTTPWTLPSNTALAVGKNIDYVLVSTLNPYHGNEVTLILAKNLLGKYFKAEAENASFAEFKPGNKELPYKVLAQFKGSSLEGLRYDQLMPYVQPEDGDAFRVLIGDFVTTEDGTGVVHIAPSFGSDDFRVAKQNGIGALTLVNKEGKFVEEVTDFAGLHVKVKEDSLKEGEKPTDVLIAIKLKEDGKAFKVEKYEHNYPHCWRTDQPVIYYPLDSWFVKTTDKKEQLIGLNKTINWKPESTGTGRFGNWLENLVDWNLSRSRFWGIPLPIWRTDDNSEEKCIGSVEQLKQELEKSVNAGFLKANPLAGWKNNADGYESFDLHRPYVDDFVLVASDGRPMRRENDLIDVWFDSGAMPYAQWHYPFENKEIFEQNFPADFIAEGVDQTRGWFFTLHAIATLMFDSVAFKNVVSNGLVLDKNGNKMSKRLGNAVDPFDTLGKYGADATRWYMVSNAQPWDNLKFNIEGIQEVQRKFFGTLYNTYSFFTIYANIDGFTMDYSKCTPYESRPELDRWIISCLNDLVKKVQVALDDYDPTTAAREIEYFLDEQLSNWYVRLGRRRFWKSTASEDKQSAYETLFECLDKLSILMSPIAPFFAEWLYSNLNGAEKSVHLADFPRVNENLIHVDLMECMDAAQQISSMVLALRKKVNLKVRQPLNRIMIPVFNEKLKNQIKQVEDLILGEVNVKKLEIITDTNGVLTKKIKLNFKALGAKVGAKMKDLQIKAQQLTQQDIQDIESNGFLTLDLSGTAFNLEKVDVEILSEDIPGWTVNSNDRFTVALDIQLSEELVHEGIARELVNRVQNLRKEAGFDVTDTINVEVQSHQAINNALKNNLSYICAEILAKNLELVESPKLERQVEVELQENVVTLIAIERN